MLIELLPRSTRSGFAALPRGRRVEETKARFDGEPLGWRAGTVGHHANDLPGLLEAYLVAGPNPVTSRDRLGYRNLELARDPAHFLSLARTKSLSIRTGAKVSGRFGRTGVTHCSRLANLLNGAQHGCPTWTLHDEEIERGLVEHMTTVAFEHLMVAPLQLDHPSEVWQHTRGPRGRRCPWDRRRISRLRVVVAVLYLVEFPPELAGVVSVNHAADAYGVPLRRDHHKRLCVDPEATTRARESKRIQGAET